MHVIKRGEEGPPPRGGTDRPARGFHRHRGAGGRWGGRSSLGGGGRGSPLMAPGVGEWGQSRCFGGVCVCPSHGTWCGGTGPPLLWGIPLMAPKVKR